MHVKAKQVAFLGILAALVSLCMIFASLIEMNTLFLLAAAAFMVGIAIREYGLMMGSGFFVACNLLGLLLSPNKLYVLTFAVLSLYIVFNEAAYYFISKKQLKHHKILFFVTKLVFFNILYVPVLLLFPPLLFTGTVGGGTLIIFLAVGQLGWFIYDKAYEYFQIIIWGKLRSRLGLLH